MDDNELEIIMKLIMYGGDAKGKVLMAIKEAKIGNFKASQTCIEEAKEALKIAHNSQTRLLTSEAENYGKSDISLLMVHGQKHLMSGIISVDLAIEIIDIYKKILN